ncbi:polymorphic toxin type 43 domain-containing protein [Microbulbifer sp. TYP-18]|uniref:polymorphic toxin type 43 domain-containing protein n=1 Tax=Microbulbifer sp. TYP-18 TaxID=3230024 RepID=UPI0034C6737C
MYFSRRPGKWIASCDSVNITYTHEQGTGFTTDIQVNGRTMSRTYNGLQQLTETVDALGGSTRYAYDGAGNPIVLQDADTNRITAKYNALGQKDWVDDPNMGLKSFTYTGFGEVETETDGNLDVTSFVYDRLGRIDSRSVNGVEEASWSYDSATNGIGLPASESRSDASYSRSYQYDALSRPYQVTTAIDGEDFVTVSHFDSQYGRLKGLSYPSGLTLRYGYNDAGYQFSTSNAASGYRYRKITQMDAWGNWDFANVGDGNYQIGRGFHAETGQMSGTAFDSLVHNHQAIAYSYDAFGNLSDKTVGIPSQSPAVNSETYLYDALNRLDYSSRTDGPDIDYDYDAIGNLLKKDDFASSYSYSGGTSGGPSAVKSVSLVGGGSKTYGYDGNGNRTHENGAQRIWYNAFNKPTRIQKGSTDLYFSYGADQMRYKQVNQGSGKTTLYIDKLFEKITTGSETQYRHFIDDIAVVTTTETSAGTSHQIGFSHRDRLGSTTAVGDHQGNLMETHSFDPFGKPRLGNVLDKTPAILDSAFTTRGFTDHEHLDDVELIHMNGRTYDYHLGRFLSVDPIIQAPGNSQSLNPYSYIMNNPLAGTDPSGYSAQMEKVTGSHIKKDVSQAKNVNGAITVGGSKLVTSLGVSSNGASNPGSGAASQQAAPQDTNNQGSRQQIQSGGDAVDDGQSNGSSDYSFFDFLGDAWSMRNQIASDALRKTGDFLDPLTGGNGDAVVGLTGAAGAIESAISASNGEYGEAAVGLALSRIPGGNTTRAVRGSGPAKGFLEVSSNFKSSKAVQNLTNSKPIDFIFDPKSQRFIMGRNSLGHDGIRMAGKIGHKNIVGGSIWRQNGKLMTDQSSGHYGTNWTASIREQFTKSMRQNGVDVSHSATYRK